jgi:hypothetical protein
MACNNSHHAQISTALAASDSAYPFLRQTPWHVGTKIFRFLAPNIPVQHIQDVQFEQTAHLALFRVNKVIHEEYTDVFYEEQLFRVLPWNDTEDTGCAKNRMSRGAPLSSYSSIESDTESLNESGRESGVE